MTAIFTAADRIHRIEAIAARVETAAAGDIIVYDDETGDESIVADAERELRNRHGLDLEANEDGDLVAVRRAAHGDE